MRKNLTIWVVLALGLALLWGGLGLCQQAPPAGQKPISFYVSEAKKIKVGQTTEGEVIALLGEPAKRDTRVKVIAAGGAIEENLLYGPNPEGRYVVIVMVNPNTKNVSRLLIKGKDY